MITLDSLIAASKSLDAMYRDEVLPKVVAFSNAWDKLTAPLRDENLKMVAKRHNVSLLPSNATANALKEIIGLARPQVCVVTNAYNANPHFTYGDFKGYAPTMVEVCGCNNIFGYWDGTMWSVVKGRGLLKPTADINRIKEYLTFYRKMLDNAIAAYEWFCENYTAIANEIEEKVNRVAELDEKDTNEFNALFNIKPKTRKVKITVIVEELT